MAMNMGYCRFKNTLSALRECAEAIDEDGVADLSDGERKAAHSLLVLCRRLADDYVDNGA